MTKKRVACIEDSPTELSQGEEERKEEISKQNEQNPQNFQDNMERSAISQATEGRNTRTWSRRTDLIATGTATNLPALQRT